MVSAHNQKTGDIPSQRSLAARVTYATFGFLLLILGIVGYIVPGLPGTPLLLVAAWLFSMSNDRLYNWMTTNRWFGRTIADYRAGLGLTRRAKTVAVVSMTVAVILSALFGTSDWMLRSMILLVGAVGVVFVLTRPTRGPAI